MTAPNHSLRKKSRPELFYGILSCACYQEAIYRILEQLRVSTVVPRAHGPPGWLAGRQQEGQAVLSREEEDFSQVPAEWDE